MRTLEKLMAGIRLITTLGLLLMLGSLLAVDAACSWLAGGWRKDQKEK